MPNYKTPQDVLKTITATDDAARIQGENRVKINNAANGVPPLTSEEAKKLGVRINVEWGEMAVAMAHARRQYENAMLGSQHFFKVELPLAPEEKRAEWAMFITNEINQPIKRSAEYDYLKRNQIAALVAHGIGLQMWYDEDDWCPQYVPIEDWRVSTDTEISFRNLEWFALLKRYNVSELNDKLTAEVKGWNKKAITKILAHYKELNFSEVNYNWETAPERMAELIKQNSGYFASDAVPTINLWHFYFKDKKKWYLRVVPETATVPVADIDEFIFTSDKPVANAIEELMQAQWGDLSVKAPFTVHGIRSLGYLLMEPCFYMNLTRCRLLQHIHESMNPWFRVNDPAGRAKATKIETYANCVLPEGVTTVPNNERHQVNAELVLSGMAQMKQLQSEASVSYTQQMDTGTQKEQTATETMANVHRVNAMMEGLLGRAFRAEAHAHRELCRRFCRKGSLNDDVKKFQKRCLKYGIPQEWLDVDLWDVQPETPMGSGNPTMAMAQADKLLAMRPMFDPTAQQEILHYATVVFTGDSRKAARWAPLDKRRGVTDAQRDAEFSFGVLMEGVPVQMKEGLSMTEQAETLIGLMAGKVSAIEQRGNMAEAQEVQGLQTVAQHVSGIIQVLAQDQQQKPRVKAYMDALGKLMNSVKGFEQRLAEQQQQDNGADPAQMAKLQTMIASSQLKLKSSELKSQQTRRHKELSFQADQRRKDQETQHQIRRDSAVTANELRNEAVRTQGEVARENFRAENEPQPETQTTE